MTGTDVQTLLRRAVQTSDPKVMREAFDRLIDRGPDALSPDAEYQTRHEDYVMEMPQSGERVRDRDAMRSMQENFPTPPTISVKRVMGANTTWVLEVNDYGGPRRRGRSAVICGPESSPGVLSYPTCGWPAVGVRPLAPNGIKIMLKRRGVAAGLTGVYAHRWRHTVAHEWKRAGGDTGTERPRYPSHVRRAQPMSCPATTCTGVFTFCQRRRQAPPRPSTTALDRGEMPGRREHRAGIVAGQRSASIHLAL